MHQAELLLRTQHNAQNQERKLLKSIRAGIWMFSQTKGWISVFKFCQPKLRHIFRRTNYHSEDMHFPSTDSPHLADLYRNHIVTLWICSICFWEHPSVPEPPMQHSWSHGEVGLPFHMDKERKTAGLIPEIWVFPVDRQICSCLSSHSMDLTVTE